MEAAVLLGLVAVGYLKNKEDSGDNPIISNVNTDVQLSNGENVYESGNYYQETKKEVKDLVEKNFNKSLNDTSNIVSDKNLDRNLNFEGYQELVYSNNSGESMDRGDF